MTPEAPDLSRVLAPGAPTVTIGAADLRRARDRLSASANDRLDAVSLGTPHFSVSEFAALVAELAGGPPFHDGVDVFVSTNRAVLSEARERGYADTVEAAGGRILTDTCSYVTPILRPDVRTVMTNSGKWAWYAPANLGIDSVLGCLSECVASARAGRVVRNDYAWR